MKVDPDAKTEAASEYDGAFSYAAESHAFVNGLHKGYVGGNSKAVQPDSQKEIHYYRGGYMAGRLLQLGTAFAAGANLL